MMKRSYFYFFFELSTSDIKCFSTAFQATNCTTIHQLHPERNRLTKRILCYFVDADVIDIEDITNTPYEDTHHQLSNDKLEIGEEARRLASSLHKDGKGPEVDSFFARSGHSMLHLSRP